MISRDASCIPLIPLIYSSAGCACVILLHQFFQYPLQTDASEGLWINHHGNSSVLCNHYETWNSDSLTKYMPFSAPALDICNFAQSNS